MSQDKIKAVENGLLPAITVKNHPQPSLNIETQMTRYCVPGVSVAVIDKGALAWVKGYGMQEAGSEIPITPNTLFQAASISKPVSVMAMLHLVEQGHINLDGDINQWLTSWQLPSHEFSEEGIVNLRRIVSHTAGLTVHGFRGYAAGEAIPTLPQILDGITPANSDAVRVDIHPGSQTRYSGGGTTIMQQLLEDISGRPFHELLHTLVLKPLGMESSTFEQPLPNIRHAQATTAHDGTGNPILGKWHTYPEKAAAGLWTTPTDLAKLAIEVMQSYVGQSNKVLSTAMTQEMLTPVKDAFGLGFGVSKTEGLSRFGHTGGNAGFRCYLVAYAETKQGAIVMTNSDNGDLLMMELIRSISHAYGWPEFKPEAKAIADIGDDLTQFEGKYQHSQWTEAIIEVRTADADLFAHMQHKGLTVKLYPESPNSFFTAEFPYSFQFLRNAKGQIEALLLDGVTQLEKVA